MSNSRTVLVTGGAGYIGSHTCALLAERGYIPVVYDNFVTGNRWAVRFGPLEVGDVLDPTAVADAIRRYRPVAVLHFAALSLVTESARRAAEYFSMNVGGTVTVLNAMRQAGLDAMVFSSTAAVYGLGAVGPISEDTQIAPCNVYGHTKAQAESTLRAAAERGELRYVALRYFNAAGAHEEGIIGEAHEPETHLIPRIMRNIIGKRRASIEIYGQDYSTIDGTCVRDYVHVSDLAEAHVLALEYLLAQQKSVSVNIGTGRGYTVREVVSAIEKITDVSIDILERPRRIGDPPILIADSSQGQKLLGFKPRYSRIEDIVLSAWNWHHAFHSLPGPSGQT